MKTLGIIAAGGDGTRFGRSGGKQMVELAGKPLVMHSIDTFLRAPVIDSLIVVIRPESLNDLRAYLTRDMDRMQRIKAIVPGGQTRQESIWKALSILAPDEFEFVIIHDGARPLVSTHLINDVFLATRTYGAATAGVPPKDTVKIMDENRYIKETLPRDSLVMIQTPQGFRLKDLMTAHRKARADEFTGTDDAILLERLGTRVHVVKGDYSNIKVTTPEDLAICEVLKARQT